MTAPGPPPDLPPLAAPAKRSVTVGGHATSVSLEDAFWRGVLAAAQARGLTVGALVTAIDGARPAGVGLATALRLFVLAEAQRR